MAVERIDVEIDDTWLLGVKLIFHSPLMHGLTRLKLLKPTVVGFAPWNLHFPAGKELVTKLTLAHEIGHLLDRVTADFPKRIVHPVRSLYNIQKSGYRKSKYEVRARAGIRAIIAGEHERIWVDPEIFDEYL